MKVSLDLAALVEAGKLTPDEAERQRALAAPATASLAINILVGFGAVAVAGGLVGLAPSPYTVVVVALMLGGLGLSILLAGPRDWAVLGSICLVTGALAAAGGGVALAEGHWASLLGAALVLGIVAFVATSGLLAGMSVLALSGAIGARSGYAHATYMIGLSEPTLTILVFAAVALGAYLLSRRLAAVEARLAIVAARASLLLVNLGFWIGSLWGDRLTFLLGLAERGAVPVIPRIVFIVGWAVALVGAAIWATRVNRPWLVNVCAVFGAIHLYTQWFERLGATPGTVLAAGVVTLAIAVGLWRFNRPAAA